MNTKTEVKSNKNKTSLQISQFKDMLEASVNSKLYSYEQAEGKKATDQTIKAITKKTTDQFHSEYRIVGTRSGHKSNAPRSLQDVFDEMTEKLQSLPNFESLDKHGQPCKAQAHGILFKVVK